MISLYQGAGGGDHTHLNRFPPGWLLGMPGFRGPCLAYVPHLSAPQGQRSIVLVLLQCDLPSVDKGFQLGLFLLSFNLLPVTDGTKTQKKKILEDKEIGAFYMDPVRLHTGDVWQGWQRSCSLSASFYPSLYQKYTKVEEPHKAAV